MQSSKPTAPAYLKLEGHSGIHEESLDLLFWIPIDASNCKCVFLQDRFEVLIKVFILVFLRKWRCHHFRIIQTLQKEQLIADMNKHDVHRHFHGTKAFNLVRKVMAPSPDLWVYGRLWYHSAGEKGYFVHLHNLVWQASIYIHAASCS